MKKTLMAVTLTFFGATAAAITADEAVALHDKHPILFDAHIEGIVEGYRFARVMEFKECEISTMDSGMIAKLVIHDLREAKGTERGQVFGKLNVALSVGTTIIRHFPCMHGKIFNN